MADHSLRRLRRGLILQTLHRNYPHPMARVLMGSQVKLFYPGEEAELVRDIAYLRDRGYLEEGSAPAGGRAVPTLSITTSGVDLVERTSDEDPGVVFEDVGLG